MPQTRERSLSQMHIESMPEMEDETVKTRVARRRMRIVQPSKVELIRESPEEKAAREAKLAAKKTMRNAILLIQSHERARKGRCYGTDGTHKNKLFYNKISQVEYLCKKKKEMLSRCLLKCIFLTFVCT